MQVHEPLARRATDLLTRIGHGDSSAVAEYDAVLYDLLRKTALQRGRFLAITAAARLGFTPSPSTLVVQSADLDEVASIAAISALERARASALRFDPERGDGASWALGALGSAYLDAAREVSRSRRLLVEVPLTDGPDDLPSPSHMTSDPAILVEVRDALDRALSMLSADERYVVVAKLHYGLTYGEIAQYMFDDPAATKRVDYLLQSARAKLRAAQTEWIDDA